MGFEKVWLKSHLLEACFLKKTAQNSSFSINVDLGYIAKVRCDPFPEVTPYGELGVPNDVLIAAWSR